MVAAAQAQESTQYMQTLDNGAFDGAYQDKARKYDTTKGLQQEMLPPFCPTWDAPRKSGHGGRAWEEETTRGEGRALMEKKGRKGVKKSNHHPLGWRREYVDMRPVG